MQTLLSFAAEPVIQDEILRASAGTGKTFQLSNRFLKLIVGGCAPQHILATTFTRKAASEILDRIIERLGNAALDDAVAARLSAELELEPVSSAKYRELLSDLLRNLYRLQIGTLDSFYGRLARTHCLELGMRPDWQFVETEDLDSLREEVIQMIFAESFASELLYLMSHGEATRGISFLMLNAIAGGYSIVSDSLDTAWDRLPKLDPLPDRKIDRLLLDLEGVKFPHGSQQLRCAEDIERARNGDWLTFIEKGCSNIILRGERSYYRKELPEQAIGLYLQLLDHARALLTARLQKRNLATRQLLNEFAARFQARQVELGLFEFEDITRELQSLVAGTSSSRLLYRLDQRVEHILLDEFQDTSPAQWRVIRPFAEQVAGADNNRSFFCVGDEKQAIYRWRGGVAEIFDIVDRQLDNISRSDPLDTSYRSSPVVIDAVNAVFQNLEQFESTSDEVNEAVRQWGKDFPHHKTVKEDLSGYVTLEWVDADADALRVAAELVGDLYRQAGKQTIGVLVRDNKSVTEIIYQLQQLGIPASQEGGNPLTDSTAVELILSVLKFADHPRDSIAGYHVATSPLAEPLGMSRTWFEQADDNHEMIHAVANHLRGRLYGEGFAPVISEFCKLLVPFVTARDGFRLEQLIEMAAAFDRSKSTRADKFIGLVRRKMIEDPTTARVRVMTIHKSKGLEFDAVVLPPFTSKLTGGDTPSIVTWRSDPSERAELVSGYVNEAWQRLLPEDYQRMFETDLRMRVRESMCMLYVAMTRAVRSLYMLVSPDKKVSSRSPQRILISTLGGDRSGKSADSDRVIYRQGDENWFKDDQAEAGDHDPLADRFWNRSCSLTRKLQLADPAHKSNRGLAFTSPSALEGGDLIELSDSIHVHANTDYFVRGNLIHGCFEQIRWLDDPRPDRDTMITALLHHSASRRQIEDAIDEFDEMLKLESIVTLLDRQRFLSFRSDSGINTSPIILDSIQMTVASERPIATRIDDQLIQGFVDRLVLYSQNGKLFAADVIDFKTDSLEPDATREIDQRIEHYRPQINAYRQAVARMVGLPADDVYGWLVFPAIDRLVPVA